MPVGEVFYRSAVGRFFRTTSRTWSRSAAETKGPKNVPSPAALLAIRIAGNGSSVRWMNANCFASFRLILYRGWCFFIRLFSRIRASTSVPVTMKSRSSAGILDAASGSFGQIVFLKVTCRPVFSGLLPCRYRGLSPPRP